MYKNQIHQLFNKSKQYFVFGLIMFEVLTNMRTFNIGPYLNFNKFFILNVLVVCGFGPCHQNCVDWTKRMLMWTCH